MYTEGTIDLNEMIIRYPFLPPGEKDAGLAQIIRKARKCHLPAFEEVSGGCVTLKGTECRGHHSLVSIF